MAIRPEETSLADEIASVCGDTFIDHNAISPVEQWVRIVASLHKAGYTIRKASDDSAGPDFGMLYRRAEPKIKRAMAELAPPGTHVNKDLIERLQQRVVAILSSEMKASGIPAPLADTLAGLMNAAMHIKAKQA